MKNLKAIKNLKTTKNFRITQKEFTGNFPKIIFNEKLSKYSTFQIGGPADFFYKIKNNSEITNIINFCKNKKIPYFILGGGSNILFDDKGFRGMVIKIETNNVEIKNNKIIADAGVLISRLLNESIKNNLSGLEKWIGLPGTVGGAVRGNAGCNGLETKDVLASAAILETKTGKTKNVANKYFKFGYRYSRLKDTNEILLNAVFQLKKRRFSREEQKKMMNEIQKTRLGKQPFGRTAGSFFKNPSKNHPAGKLIEDAGLKGKIIGKAQIPKKHANFFVNLGNASSRDIIELAKLVKHEVKAKFGIELKEEVQIISETGLTELK